MCECVYVYIYEWCSEAFVWFSGVCVLGSCLCRQIYRLISALQFPIFSSLRLLLLHLFCLHDCNYFLLGTTVTVSQLAYGVQGCAGGILRGMGYQLRVAGYVPQEL